MSMGKESFTHSNEYFDTVLSLGAVTMNVVNVKALRVSRGGRWDKLRKYESY